jgi:GMP synthase-like glutamine amidotransferase
MSRAGMKKLTVIQHNSAEYLGLIEDHLEGRRIRFNYVRPFTGAVEIPALDAIEDGLVLLGGGPWGSAGERDLPSLAAEQELARACLMANKLVIGFGLGAQILARAAGGSSRASPLECRTGEGTRCDDDALGGYLPDSFPYCRYGRDRALPPAYARILARDESGAPLAFQMGETAFGFEYHPGFKVAMVEDLVMEFEEAPTGIASSLGELRTLQREIEAALVPFMTGLIAVTGLMR